MKKKIFLAIPIALVLLLAGLLVPPITANAIECEPIPAQPIAQGPLYPFVPWWQKYIGSQATPDPVPHVEIPQHPYMAPNGVSNMHNDGYMTDTYDYSGPLGINPQVISTNYGFAECATVTFDKFGRVLTVCTSLAGPRLLLLDPDTLDELASYNLPPRPWYWIFDEIGIFEDPSGGAYFYIDDNDNVVVTTHDYRILVIEVPPLGNPCLGFQVVEEYDLSSGVIPQPWPNRDKIGPAIPDWGGDYYWYTTRYGLVGLVDRITGQIDSIELPGEQIQNSPAVAEDGFYVISDYAMYHFHADDEGNIEKDWRTEYDRGTRKKPGMLTQGSGTTPNIFGDLVAIADNADPKMNVIFLRRDTGEEVCSIPVFGDGESCTENALIGVQIDDDTYSVIVENNYGYENFLTTAAGRSTVGGVTRINVITDSASETGYSCYEVWTSNEISCTPVPKLSLANGLVYLYTKPHTCLIDKWYFTTVDFDTGATVYKVLTGTGDGYNNNWAPITISPDGATYIGTLNGLISIRDVTP